MHRKFLKRQLVPRMVAEIRRRIHVKSPVQGNMKIPRYCAMYYVRDDGSYACAKVCTIGAFFMHEHSRACPSLRICTAPCSYTSYGCPTPGLGAYCLAPNHSPNRSSQIADQDYCSSPEIGIRHNMDYLDGYTLCENTDKDSCDAHAGAVTLSCCPSAAALIPVVAVPLLATALPQTTGS